MPGKPPGTLSDILTNTSFHPFGPIPTLPVTHHHLFGLEGMTDLQKETPKASTSTAVESDKAINGVLLMPLRRCSRCVTCSSALQMRWQAKGQKLSSDPRMCARARIFW